MRLGLFYDFVGAGDDGRWADIGALQCFGAVNDAEATSCSERCSFIFMTSGIAMTKSPGNNKLESYRGMPVKETVDLARCLIFDLGAIPEITVAQCTC
jgi:hypothetical protein